MTFNKGRLKTGGRAKGVTNLITNDCREKLALIIDDKVETLNNDLEQLKKKDLNAYLKVIVQLIPYVITKKTDASTLIVQNSDKPIIIDWTNNYKTD